MYDMYISYLNIFEESYRSREETNEETEGLFSRCRTKEYFFKLICVVCLFWFVYSVIYLDWTSFEMKNCFDQFKHALKRLDIFEKAYEMIESKDFI